MFPLLSLILLSSVGHAESAKMRLAMATAEGMTADDLGAIDSRISEELALMGAEMVSGDAPDEGCLEDAVCSKAWVNGLAGGLVLELVRVGPILIVTSHLVGPDGAKRHQAEREIQTEGFSGSASLLGAEMAAEIRLLASASQGGAAATGEPSQLSEHPTQNGSLLPWVAVGGGLGLAGLGVLTSIGGVSVCLWQTLVAYAPGTLGSSKASALIVAPVAAGVALLGAVGLVTGGTIVLAGLMVE